jgi:hypothetical protein
MTTLDFIDRFTNFTGFLANVLVCAFAAMAYQNTRKRSLLFIAIACGIGAIFFIAPLIREDKPSLFYWWVYTVAMNVGSGLWIVGFWLLFRNYEELIKRSTQPSASTSVDLTAPVDNSNTTNRPPSVS